jgi:hypothetical protein
MSSDTTVRMNRQGSPCPPWCTRDHDEELYPGASSATHSSAYAAGSVPFGPRAWVIADGNTYKFTAPMPPKVGASAGTGAAYFAELGNAEELAMLIEQLAECQPEELRALAAAVRAAAATARNAQ